MTGGHPASRVHRLARDRALSQLAAEQPGQYALLRSAARVELATTRGLFGRPLDDAARLAARAALRELHPDRYGELFDEHQVAAYTELGIVEGERSRLARHRRQRARARAKRGQAGA